MSKKTIIIIILSVVLIGSIVLALKMYNKPFVNIAETKPNLLITSDVLVDNFSNNEIEANTKYLEEIIQVNGTIIAIDSDKTGKGIITLGNEDTIGSVICHLSEKENEKNLKTGQTVNIKGICTGYLMDVVLVKCVIVP
ncbi:OB-fold putative lipoprotein [Aquimarina litoralis]|uniref:OB-fold putative lipoprotein n=1 Tax=Aquimarina litoralis TaxID=584605 RepID=UPI001C580CD0|nr:OB-fold putative lipoprotein [Aquimarina litoralis]MBW1296483.1 hypothetical protein [Aquimarina litoralis]